MDIGSKIIGFEKWIELFNLTEETESANHHYKNRNAKLILEVIADWIERENMDAV